MKTGSYIFLLCFALLLNSCSDNPINQQKEEIQQDSPDFWINIRAYNQIVGNPIQDCHVYFTSETYGELELPGVTGPDGWLYFDNAGGYIENEYHEILVVHYDRESGYADLMGGTYYNYTTANYGFTKYITIYPVDNINLNQSQKRKHFLEYE